MPMKILCNQVTVSDADVIIKLYQANHLSLLGNIFTEIVVPGKVCEEITRITGLQEEALFTSNSWLKRIIITDQAELTPEQIQLIQVTMRSFEYALDDGEREAFALANELNIPLLLIDDLAAKRIIEHNSEIIGLSHVEVLFLATLKKVINKKEAKRIFQQINSVVSHPINTPINVLMTRAENRFAKLGLL